MNDQDIAKNLIGILAESPFSGKDAENVLRMRDRLRGIADGTLEIVEAKPDEKITDISA